MRRSESKSRRKSIYLDPYGSVSAKNEEKLIFFGGWLLSSVAEPDRFFNGSDSCSIKKQCRLTNLFFIFLQYPTRLTTKMNCFSRICFLIWLRSILEMMKDNRKIGNRFVLFHLSWNRTFKPAPAKMSRFQLHNSLIVSHLSSMPGGRAGKSPSPPPLSKREKLSRLSSSGSS